MIEPDAQSEPVGMVLGTEDPTPLTFWVGVAKDAYLQLDDAVIVDTEVPGRGPLRISGIVQDVRARHEGATFDTDVFLIDRGVLPVDTAVAAQVVATRFEPELFVPPMPGIAALRARGKDRDEAMYFDQMERRVPAGLSRDGEPIFLDLDFLDGSRGAHLNISGISGVATKTTYALFLLYALFHSDSLGPYRANTKAIVSTSRARTSCGSINRTHDSPTLTAPTTSGWGSPRGRSNRWACGRRPGGPRRAGVRPCPRSNPGVRG